jgi:hypothetical protein
MRLHLLHVMELCNVKGARLQIQCGRIATLVVGRVFILGNAVFGRQLPDQEYKFVVEQQ